MLNGIVQAHGSNYGKIDPEFARNVKNHFYVDDLNTGVYSTEEGFDSIRKLKFDFWKLILMLQSGGRMTKIYAN